MKPLGFRATERCTYSSFIDHALCTTCCKDPSMVRSILLRETGSGTSTWSVISSSSDHVTICSPLLSSCVCHSAPY
nr:hypothetical protein Q903MT_gene234 [Picea sitchensis]